MGTVSWYDHAVNSDDVKLVPETCEQCGQGFARPTGRRMRRCSTCRNEALVAALDEQHAKSGPTYERVVRNSLIFWRGEAKRLKIRV